MKKAWQLIIKTFDRLEMGFLIIFTSVIGVAIIIEIILRIFSIQGSKWIEELARMMLVTTTLVGSSVAVKTKGHVGMTALVDILPTKFANLVEILADFICGAVFIYISYYAAKWTVSLYMVKRTMDSAPFPLWPFWVVISLSFLSTGVRYMLEIVKVIKNMRAGIRVAAELKEM